MLSLLPRTSELYDAASEHGFDQERAINQQRQRHGICGKEAATRLMRWNSVPAQRVNIQFAIMLDWVRLNAQYGWFREGELSDVGADDDPRPIEMRRPCGMP